MSKENKGRAYYIRRMSSTIVPSEAEKRDLYNLANNIPFDDRVNHEAELADLNIALVQSYLKEIGSSLYRESENMEFIDLCRSMNIISELPEYVKPKNVGLMFFSLEPDKFFPYAAIEEALSNAVYHKGYDEREPVEVRVEPDRIIIVSHPGADRLISQEGLREYRVYSRRYRNRRIGEFLKEMHLTEGRNTGFRKIRNALRNNGSPEPLFETDEERTYFATTIFIQPDFKMKMTDDSVNDRGNGPGHMKKPWSVSCRWKLSGFPQIRSPKTLMTEKGMARER